MSHIFISYSRKDKAFVTRLFDALEAAGREVWLDVKDIAPSAEWMAEISRSIESADDLIFVISPDSLHSPICARELAHAVAHNKRLVPIVWREPAGVTIPPELEKLNWIFFRSEDLFEQGFSTLESALDTDLDYVRLHTRLLVRAREWEARHRSGSFTLRGEDLNEAEAWLAEGTKKEPRPAELQVEYITFSRRAERTRQRRTLTAALVALAVTTGLAIVAFWQSQVATSREHARATQQAIAEDERRIALSGKLATQSRLLLDEQLDLSLLLAVLSGQINATVEASSALHDALEYRPDLVQYLSDVPPGGVTQMAYTPGGDQLVAVGMDGALWRWDLSTGKPVGDPVRRADQLVLDLVPGPQGETWVVSLNDSGVFVWEAASGELLGPQVIFSDDLDQDGRPDLPHIAALNPEGDTLAIAVYEDLSIWDVSSGELVGRSDVLLGFPPSALEFSPDGSRLASAGNEWQIYFWDPRSGLSTDSWETTQTRNITSLAFSADGRFIASGSEDGTVNLFDLETGEQRLHQPGYSITTGQELPAPALGHPAAVRSLVFSPDGEKLISGAEDGNMLVWDTNTLTPATIPRPAYVGPVLTLAYHPEGESFAVGGGTGSITIWQPAETWRLSRSKGEVDWDLSFDHSGMNGDTGLPLPNSGYSATTGCAVSVESYERCPAGWVQAFQADGQPIDLEPADIPDRPGPLAFSSDGTLLAVAACLGEGDAYCSESGVWIWNLPGGELQSHVTRVAWLDKLVFSPDDRYLAYGGMGRDIMLFDRQDGREFALTLLPLPGQVTDIAFNPAGSLLAACASYEDPGPYANSIYHGRIVVWETQSGQVIAHSDLPGSTAGDLGFNEDGKLLEYLNLEGFGDLSTIWTLDIDQWQELACRIANRNLTESEWGRYMIGEEYREVCP
jgi:WD40 repeat protein